MTKCIICQSPLNIYCRNEAKLLCSANEKFLIYKCPNCGLGKTNNLSSQKGDYHRDETYIIEEKLFKNIFQKRVEIIKKFIQKGKVLEIGCSTGLMLSIFKNMGWEVEGVEISKQAASAAQKRGINIYTQPFKEISFDKKFDLIILNHTLEHLSDPPKIIRKVSTLLTKDGILYIDLPNFGGLTSSLMKCLWPHLLPNEHNYHFTYQSLTLLLKKFNLNPIFDERASGIWDYANPFEGILLSLLSFKKRFFIEFFTAIPSLIISKMKIGSDLMVIAKKN